MRPALDGLLFEEEEVFLRLLPVKAFSTGRITLFATFLAALFTVFAARLRVPR